MHKVKVRHPLMLSFGNAMFGLFLSVLLLIGGGATAVPLFVTGTLTTILSVIVTGAIVLDMMTPSKEPYEAVVGSYDGLRLHVVKEDGSTLNYRLHRQETAHNGFSLHTGDTVRITTTPIARLLVSLEVIRKAEEPRPQGMNELVETAGESLEGTRA
ncbi:hypothetical protein [Paenibacillus lutrae]|uniref:Uncharacterized protein n=1 Tax=Paenibacillus lutrae TaxID=2078573 RepID=A0A7X3JXK6_9BACL|nr:hypothetical protein [Paenibacillus lutrae]MVO97995.1 hypothetical protein [Paenibacillus lutrae]